MKLAILALAAALMSGEMPTLLKPATQEIIAPVHLAYLKVEAEQAALPPPARRRRGSGDDLLAILLPVSTRVADLALRHHLPHRQPGQAVAVEPGPVRDDGQGGGGDAGTVDLEGEREG